MICNDDLAMIFIFESVYYKCFNYFSLLKGKIAITKLKEQYTTLLMLHSHLVMAKYRHLCETFCFFTFCEG